MQELRESGIDVVGRVPWGAHFCQFYQTKSDLTDTLVPFFKAGLESNEACMWVTSDPLSPAEAAEALAQAVPDFDSYVRKGQVEILPHSEWYLKGGSFDLNRVLNGWAGKLEQALARGFTGLRVTGNTAWLERAGWDSFAEYEAAINGVIGKHRMIALCTYSLDKCNASDVMDVISNHEFALMVKDGRWQMIENSAYKEAKAALVASEKKYQGLFNSMTEGFALHQIVLDGDGKPCDYRFIEANPAFEKLTGLSFDNARGKTVKEVLPGIEESWIETYGKVALTGEPAVFESFSAPLNRWYEVYAYSPQKGQFATFFRDVTERRRAEDTVVKQRKTLQAIIGNAHTHLVYLDPDFSFVAVNATYAATCQKTPEELIGKNHFYFYPNEENEAIFRKARDSGQPVSFHDKPFVFPDQPERGVTYWDWTLTPVKDGKGRVEGLVFSLVETTDRVRTEQALRESEEKYRNIVETTSEGILVIDLNGKITFSNHRMSELLGYPREELAGRAGLDFMPGQREAVLAARAELEKGRRLQCEFTFRRKDGTTLWTSAALSPLLDASGRHFANLSMYSDISERKRAEEALRASEQRYRDIIETANEGILVVSPDGKLDFVNDKMAEMLGYPKAELIGKMGLELFDEAQRENVLKVREESRRRGRIQAEYQFRRKDGSVLWTIANVSALHDESGRLLGTQAMHTDITERKQMEEALRRANEELEERVRQRTAEVSTERQRFYDVLETMPAMVCLLTADHHVAFANRSFRDKFGESGGRHCYEYCFGLSQPCGFCQSYRVLETGKPHHWEVSTPDGKSVIDAYDFPFADADGSPMILEMDLDITEQKRAEAALQEMNATLERRVADRTAALRETTDYLENLFNYANAPIIVWDPQFRITRFNHAFERLTGLSAAHVLGKQLDILFPQESKAESLDHIRKAMAGERWEVVEIPIRGPGGNERVVLWNSANVFAPDGKTLTATIAQGQDITERKRAEEALRETTDYLENLFNYANAPIIVWDPQFRITRFNHAFERLTGLSAAHVLGKQLDILFPQESKAESLDHIRKAMAGERWEVVEIPIRHTDGTVRTVLWNSANVYSPIDDTLAATIAQGQDITERKQAEDALREREAEVSAILESAPMLMLLVDSDRRVIKSNRAAARFAGRTVEEMMGLRSGEALRCLHSLDDPRGCGFGPSCATCSVRLNVMDTIERRNSHHQVECSLPFIKEDSTEELTFLLYTFPLSLPQERTLVCIQDVTPLKRSEEAVRGLNAELTHRASQLENANKELESFAYSVSHDLRAPLRSMEGFSLALLEDYQDKLDEQGKDYLRRIQGSSQMMAQLIDDILKLSRITRSEMERETIDLSEMARSIASDLRQRDPKRHARFTIAKGLEHSGDSKLVRLALTNLMENAWKFTAKTEQARIQFGVKETDGKRAYFVKDNGVGFDMAYADKLFRPFQRLHSSSEFPGTGIGLASVQRIIRRHGGDIWVEAAIGKGATFFFTLG